MDEGTLGKSINKISDLIIDSSKIVVFTGAGVSTESGIPDFRSPGGLWDKYNPDDFLYQKFLTSLESREKYWKMNSELHHTLACATPNEAHHAIVKLEHMGKLECVITQNIDSLHQKAGLIDDKVIELHGTNMWVNCLSCQERYPRQEVQGMLGKGLKAPTCGKCGGILKPATISFGQPMPIREMKEAENKSRSCDLFIVIGSSLVVQPAAFMPMYAKQGGAKLVIVNKERTSYDGSADLVLHGEAGMIMKGAVDRVEQMLKYGDTG